MASKTSEKVFTVFKSDSFVLSGLLGCVEKFPVLQEECGFHAAAGTGIRVSSPGHAWGQGWTGMVSVRKRKAEEEEGKAEFSVFHFFRQPGDSKKH